MPLLLSRKPDAYIVCHNKCGTSAASFASRVNSNQYYSCSPKSQSHLFSGLYSRRHPLSLGPRFEWGKTCVEKNKTPFNREGIKWRKPQEKPQRQTCSRTEQHITAYKSGRKTKQVETSPSGARVPRPPLHLWKRTRPHEIISKKKTDLFKSYRSTYIRRKSNRREQRSTGAQGLMIQIRRYVRRCWQAIQNPLNPTNIWLLSLMPWGNPDHSQLHESVYHFTSDVLLFRIL